MRIENSYKTRELQSQNQNAHYPNATDYTLLIILAALWGSSFLLIKVAINTLPAATLTFGRLAVAALVAYGVILWIKEDLPKGVKTWGLITLSALVGNALPFTLISWGEEIVDSAVAAILMGVMPLTTLVIAHIFTQDEKLNWAKSIGVSLGVFGLIVLMGFDKLSQLGDETIRQLAIAGAAVCYGLNAIITKFLIHLPKRSLLAAVLIVSAIIMIPVSLTWDQPWVLQPSVIAVTFMIVLGLAQTALAGFIMFVIVERQGASFFSQINFLVPVFGVFFGMLFLSERLPPDAYLALGIIMMGIVIARYGHRVKKFK